ncbi:unnamed protein product, partial [Discosporangium mesarthrocarpum]
PTNRLRPNVLLGLSSSVAAIKCPELVVKLRAFSEVQVVETQASRHFLSRSQGYNPSAYNAFRALEPPVTVIGDNREWEEWDRVGDPVLHIQLREAADAMVIAPLSANTLGKLANGLCDNLLVSGCNSHPPPVSKACFISATY